MYGDKVTEPIESAYDIGPAVKQTITVSRRYQQYVGLFGVLRHRGTLDSTFRALGSCSGQGKIFPNTMSFLFGKAKAGIKKKIKNFKSFLTAAYKWTAGSRGPFCQGQTCVYPETRTHNPVWTKRG